MNDKYILSGPQQLQELIQDVYTSSNNAIYVLSDLLQYENIDAGTFSLDRSRQMLGTWSMADNLRALKAFAKGRQISLFVSHNFDQSILIKSNAGEVLMPFSLMVMDIDRIRIEQVVRNLVSNAVKFTKQNGHIKVLYTRSAYIATGHLCMAGAFYCHSADSSHERACDHHHRRRLQQRNRAPASGDSGLGSRHRRGEPEEVVLAVRAVQPQRAARRWRLGTGAVDLQTHR